MNNWRTIITFTQPHEAHIAKGLLESGGIETIIRDEFTAQVQNFYSNAIGGVKVDVKESDFEEGISILKEGGYIIEGVLSGLQHLETVELECTTNKSRCPYCNSDNISLKKEPNLLTVIVYFVLGAFFPIFKRSYVCFDCNKHWKYKKI